MISPNIVCFAEKIFIKPFLMIQYFTLFLMNIGFADIGQVTENLLITQQPKIK